MKDIQHYLRPGLLQLKQLPPLSLYVHLPWCLQKCPYCDFNSHALSERGLAPAQERQYLSALLADLDAALPLVWGRPIASIFLGGGTPSLFSPDVIAELLSQLRARLAFSAEIEITLEANPGTFERERFKAFRSAGVNRLSVGVQSFNDRHLKTLGRVHSSAQARLALEEATTSFEHFNIDLMYALPNQSAEELKLDLTTALAFQPPHLSIYHLTIEPNTYFAKYPPVIPDEDSAYTMLDTIIAMTEEYGLARYEVSAFAKNAHQCRHNLNYWQFGDYLGIGAGAHSKLSFAHRIVRQVRTKEPIAYIKAALQGNCVTQDEEIKHSDLAFEFMLNVLRLKDGVDLCSFSERTGLSTNALNHGLEAARAKGLMSPDVLNRLKASDHGFDFLTDLQSQFLPIG